MNGSSVKRPKWKTKQPEDGKFKLCEKPERHASRILSELLTFQGLTYNVRSPRGQVYSIDRLPHITNSFSSDLVRLFMKRNAGKPHVPFERRTEAKFECGSSPILILVYLTNSLPIPVAPQVLSAPQPKALHGSASQICRTSVRPSRVLSSRVSWKIPCRPQSAATGPCKSFQTSKKRWRMPDPEWNSTTAPEEGATVYVLALDDIGHYVFHSRSSFETIAGGTLTPGKNLTLLSRGGARRPLPTVDPTATTSHFHFPPTPRVSGKRK